MKVENFKDHHPLFFWLLALAQRFSFFYWQNFAQKRNYNERLENSVILEVFNREPSPEVRGKKLKIARFLYLLSSV
jgi:hypothetical protein